MGTVKIESNCGGMVIVSRVNGETGEEVVLSQLTPPTRFMTKHGHTERTVNLVEGIGTPSKPYYIKIQGK